MIFLTGGTGLVGAHILLNLVDKGQKVRALKRKSSSLNVINSIFSHYNKKHLLDTIEWVEGDICDVFLIEDAIAECDRVIHCAGLVSFNPKHNNQLMNINVDGTKNIVNICLEKDIKKLGYVSSIATLGGSNSSKEKTESDFWKANSSNTHYALSKYLAEQEVWRGIEEGLNAVIINPSVILGPGNWSKGSSQLFEKVWRGLKFYSLGGSGYVDVEDVASCMLKLMESNIVNERFILNSENIKYRALFNAIAKHMNKPKPHIKVTPVLKEIAWRYEWIKSIFTNKDPLVTKETANTSMKTKCFSNEKIKSTLGHTFIPISESIKKYSHWFLDEHSNA